MDTQAQMAVMQNCSQLAEYLDLIPAAVGGVIGALAGGIPAWWLARRQSNETLRRDKDQRRDREKALAFGTSVKLLTIINSTISLSNYVKSCMALRTVPNHEHMEPWQVLIPMIGHTDEGSIRFTAEEMAVFAAAGEYDFMQDMLLLSLRHASSLETFGQYCDMRNEFRSVGPIPDSFQGEIGSTILTREQADSYKPYTIPLNNVALGLDFGLNQDIILAKKVTEKFGPITEKYFEVDKFVTLSFPSDEELATMRQPRNQTA